MRKDSRNWACLVWRKLKCFRSLLIPKRRLLRRHTARIFTAVHRVTSNNKHKLKGKVLT